MTVLEPVIEFILGFKVGKDLTLDQVVQGADRPRRPVLRVMDRLVREGHLEEIDDNRLQPRYGEVGPPRRNPTWRIIAHPLLADFTPRPERLTVRDRMWRLIRARRRFTRCELIRLAGATLGSVEDYTKMLARAGYIRVIGKDSRRQVFMLVKDPGPARPAIKEMKNAQQDRQGDSQPPR